MLGYRDFTGVHVHRKFKVFIKTKQETGFIHELYLPNEHPDRNKEMEALYSRQYCILFLTTENRKSAYLTGNSKKYPVALPVINHRFLKENNL